MKKGRLPRTKATEFDWSIERTDSHAHRLRLDYSSRTATRTIYLLTDLHWDSAHCQRDVLKRHLEQAKQENALILMAGDIYDVMQGKWDPRRDQSVLRPEHRGNRYLDSILETSVEWFAPYAPWIALMSPGIHETSVQSRNDPDLIQRLADGLRPHGFRGAVGQYWGFVLVMCEFLATSLSKRIHYHHGYGGGGEITRGLIDNSRTRRQYEGADVYVSGHIHRRNADENNPIRLTPRGNIEIVQQYFLRCASYKLEHGDGWHVSKGRAARPIGGWAVDLTWRRLQGKCDRNDDGRREFIEITTRML